MCITRNWGQMNELILQFSVIFYKWGRYFATCLLLHPPCNSRQLNNIRLFRVIISSELRLHQFRLFYNGLLLLPSMKNEKRTSLGLQMSFTRLPAGKTSKSIPACGDSWVCDFLLGEHQNHSTLLKYLSGFPCRYGISESRRTITSNDSKIKMPQAFG